MCGVACITHHKKVLGIVYKTEQESDLICHPVPRKTTMCYFFEETLKNV